ncbi:MAG: hypothetical protein IJR49_00515 [Treponema sp.]|nr:hypothetical protein [Treponema sp.]
MKKFAILGAVLFALVASTAFVGCDDTTKEILNEFSPRNEWIQETITVTNSNLYCYLYYNDTTEDVNIANNGINNGKLQPGLTIVIEGTSGNSLFNNLAANKIVYKHFANNTEVEYGDTSKLTMTSGFWTAIGVVRKYYLSDKRVSAPNCVKQSTGYDVVDSSSLGEDWKKVLAVLITNEVLNRLQS